MINWYVRQLGVTPRAWLISLLSVRRRRIPLKLVLSILFYLHYSSCCIWQCDTTYSYRGQSTFCTSFCRCSHGIDIRVFLQVESSRRSVDTPLVQCFLLDWHAHSALDQHWTSRLTRCHDNLAKPIPKCQTECIKRWIFITSANVIFSYKNELL